MISFDLCCLAVHRFEGWFASAKNYEEQLARGLIICPYCGDRNIKKMLSAPNVGRKANQVVSANAMRRHDFDSAPDGDQSDVGAVINAPDAPGLMAKMAEKIAEVQKQLLQDSAWVGGHFAEEARAIHYGETESRLIHGETSAGEAQDLHEEGISVAPLLFPYIPPATRN